MPRMYATYFNATYDYLRLVPTLAGDLLEGGVNCVTTGCFLNPADNPQNYPDYATWGRKYDAWFDGVVALLTRYGFAWLATGDDLARSKAEADATLGRTLAWGPRAAQHAAGRLAACPLVVGLEVQD